MVQLKYYIEVRELQFLFSHSISVEMEFQKFVLIRSFG